ncbi:MAG: hypothetical protein CMJ43_01100 [Phyllobacteriaceae bacterium]|nr:hypothetical protein [Phyllobacteriaceae bacterium]
MYGAGGVRMYLDTDGKVGIGTRTPSTTLHLSGTLRIANGGESCDANRAGGIRYNSGTFEFCDGGGTWESMATVAAAGAGAVTELDDLSDAAKETTGNNVFIGHEGGSFGAQNIQNTAIGIGALDALDGTGTGSEGRYNTALGVNALSANTTGHSNTASGAAALSVNTTGYNNTASGVSALRTNTTGYGNTSTGVNTLYANPTGYFNTATGLSAMTENTTGYSNTATGVSALRFNTTGYGNTSTGVNTLYANTTGFSNTATGANALRFNTTGNYNTAIGRYALYNNTEAGYNTALGANALSDISGTQPNANTALGYNTGRGIVTGSSNTIIGANVTGLASDLSNTVIIADGDGNQRIYANSSGNVGIGTTNPNNRLVVMTPDGSNQNAVLIFGQDQVDKFGSLGYNDAADKVYFSGGHWTGTKRPIILQGNGGQVGIGQGAAGTTTGIFEVSDTLYVLDTGVVGIGRNAPQTRVDISGTLRIANGGEACDSNRAGGIRYNSGTFEFCDGGGTWESMATVAGGEGGTSDRIVSGTTSLVAGEDGSLKLTASGTSKMIYSAGGSLGLGTDAPQGGTFHINGANGTANAAINLSISGTTTTQMSAIQFVTKSGNTPRLGQSDTNGWSLSARGDGLSIPQQQNDLIFYSYAGVTPKLVMAMDSVSQSVGIGTDDPEATLDVSGTVKVAGTGSEGCDPSKWGMLRRNPATGKLQICRH